MRDSTTTEHQLEKPHICGVKLVSGEDIICILTLEKENNRYSMVNPALVFLKEKEDEPGKFQIVFSPFCPAADSGQLSIVTDKLVAMYAPAKNIAEQFRDNFRHPGVPAKAANDVEETPKFEG
jgi:hypothetical protein